MVESRSESRQETSYTNLEKHFNSVVTLMLNSVTASARAATTRPLSAFVSDARWPGWQAVIGIETHAQIKSRRKLFSREFCLSLACCLRLTCVCPSIATHNSYDEPPNTRVSLFDAAFPGTLPVRS